MFNRFTFESPYYYRGTVVARWAADLAMFLWAAFTFLRILETDDLNPPATWVAYQAFLRAPVWMYACVLGVVSVMQMWRLLARTPPSKVGTICNALIALFWLYTALVVTLVLRPALPLASATSVVMAIVAWCGFVSNPRRDDDGDL